MRTDGWLRLAPGTLYSMLSKFEDEQLIEKTRVEGRRQWYQTVGSPNLYYIGLQLYVDDKLEDDTVIPVGLRSVTYNSSEGFKINLQTVKLKGVVSTRMQGCLDAVCP